MVQKNEDISKSVSSIDSGPIFASSLGQDLSGDAFVMSILFPERISSGRIGFCMTPKNRNFHEISNFLEMSRIFGKSSAAAIFLIFFGPAGGSRTLTGAFAPEGIPYDS